MAKQTINVGTIANDNTGDTLRVSFTKVNANFTELYTAGGGSGIQGIQGIQGTLGSQGINGEQGIQGTSGVFTGTIDRLVNVSNEIVLGTDGKLTLPNASILESATSTVIASGTATAALKIIYADAMAQLTDFFTQNSAEPGYPWGVTLPFPNANFVYGQIVEIAPGTFPNQTAVTTSAGSARGSYFEWLNANSVTNTTINVSDSSWTFDADGIITLPGGTILGRDVSGPSTVGVYSMVNNEFVINTSNGLSQKKWAFDTDGKITLPVDGDIVDNTGTSVISGRVKSTAIGDRRIEEVTGFNQVSVTERITSNDIPATVYGSAAQNLNSYVEIVWDAALDAYLQGTTPYSLTVSTDGGNIWHPAYIGGNNPNVSQQLIVTSGQSVLQAAADSVIAYRVITGADPVVWWDKNTLPGGGQDFRGSVIDYHAWTGESTIIGTIHIVTDNGERHISHSEVASGSTDGENDDLWFVQNEGAISYRRIDGEAKTLKVHWTAKVFYGSEIWD